MFLYKVVLYYHLPTLVYPYVVRGRVGVRPDWPDYLVSDVITSIHARAPELLWL